MSAITVYILILIGMAFLSFGMNRGVRYRKLCFVLAFILAFVFFALIKPGTDYVSYEAYYNNFVFRDLITSDQEPGYVLLNCVLKLFIKDSAIGIAVINTLTLVVSFCAIYSLRERIDLGASVFSWFCIQYFTGYIIAMALAASFVLLGMSLLLRKKDVKALISFLIASSLHFTALLVVAFFVCYKLIGNGGKSKLKRWVIIVLLFAATFALPWLIELLMKLLPAFAKYRKYTHDLGRSFGFGQLIIYVPVWFSLYYLDCNCTRDEIFRKVYDSFVWEGFSIAMMAYVIGMLDRMFVYFSSAFIFLVPYVIRHHRENRGNLKFALLKPRVDAFLFGVYCVMRFGLFMYEHYRMSGLDEIVFIWQ